MSSTNDHVQVTVSIPRADIITALQSQGHAGTPEQVEHVIRNGLADDILREIRFGLSEHIRDALYENLNSDPPPDKT